MRSGGRHLPLTAVPHVGDCADNGRMPDSDVILSMRCGYSERRKWQPPAASGRIFVKSPFGQLMVRPGCVELRPRWVGWSRLLSGLTTAGPITLYPEQTKPINRSAFLLPVVYLERQGASGPVRIELRPGQRSIVYRALQSAGFAFDGE